MPSSPVSSKSFTLYSRVDISFIAEPRSVNGFIAGRLLAAHPWPAWRPRASPRGTSYEKPPARSRALFILGPIYWSQCTVNGGSTRVTDDGANRWRDSGGARPPSIHELAAQPLRHPRRILLEEHHRRLTVRLERVHQGDEMRCEGPSNRWAEPRSEGRR